MKYPVCILVLVLSIPFASFAQKSTNKFDNIKKEWLIKNVKPLKTTKAENGFDDLQFLKPLLKDKELIGLGEATHGTSEFFQMKHRLVEFLVTEMGYRAFAIEASMADCESVNDYICNGRGSIYKAISDMRFWTWNTEEVANMVKWMKKYNEGKADNDKLHFYGFDMQYASRASKKIEQSIKETGLSISQPIAQMLKQISSGNEKFPRDTIKLWKLLVDSLYYLTKKNASLFNNKGSGYEQLQQQIILVKQFLALSNPKRYSTGFTIRDSCMSANIKWLKALSGNNKMILWAHNFHVSKYSNQSKWNNVVTMGYRLSKMFGDKYYNIGFDFYDGNLQAVWGKKGLRVLYAKPAIKHSLAAYFHSTGIPLFYIDLRKASKSDTIGNFFNSPQLIRNIGAVYYPNSIQRSNYDYEKLPVMYNALIFVDHTNAAVPAEDFGNAMTNMDAKPYRCKEIKVCVKLRMEGDTTKGSGHLWFRVDKKNRTMGFFDNMENRPAKSREWKQYEISGRVDKDAKNLAMGTFLLGEGKLLADDFHFYMKQNNEWVEIPEMANSFEKDNTGEKPVSWKSRATAYKIQVIDNMPCTGSKCLLIER